MMPDDRLSTQLEYGKYLSPENQTVSGLLDYEMGGVALNDASQGMEVQVWTMRVVPTGGTADPVDIRLSAPNTPEFTLFSDVGITEGSLAFDQNMEPFVAYVQNGQARFRWYDATVPGFVITDLPAGSTTPRCTLDDKRQIQILLDTSDIILVYIYNDNLYMRMQRDRYTVDYLLRGDLSGIAISPRINKIGMNDVGRLQVLLEGNFYS